MVKREITKLSASFIICFLIISLVFISPVSAWFSGSINKSLVWTGGAVKFSGTIEDEPFTTSMFFLIKNASLPENGTHPTDFTLISVSGQNSTFGVINDVSGGSGSWEYIWDTSQITHGSLLPGSEYIFYVLNQSKNYPDRPQDGYLTFGIYVEDPIVADFSGSPTTGAAPLTVAFTDNSTNTPTSWSWSFGDSSGENASMQNPVHTYTNPDIYTVSLDATNEGGSNITTRPAYIQVTEPVIVPVAGFTTNVTSGTAPLFVQFNDTSTGSPTIWNWSFGDGNWFNTTIADERNVTYSYDTTGIYTARLTVANDDGSDTTDPGTEITVNAAGMLPVADFTALPVSGTAPLTVQFNDTSDVVGPLMWNWSFGDSPSSWFNTTNNAARNASHEYSIPGTCTVSLTVTNDTGSNTKTRTDYIMVISGGSGTGPVAGFITNVTSGTEPLAVQFNDTSSGSPTSWNWSFGDESWSNTTVPDERNVTHVYTYSGFYIATLTVSNDDGSDTTIPGTDITVNTAGMPPTADFTASPLSGTAPLSVQFNDSSTGSPTSWNWSFGDDTWFNTTVAEERNTTHSYSNSGSYTAKLTVANDYGTDTTDPGTTITVNEAGTPPIAVFTTNVTSGTAPLPVQFNDTSTGSPTSWNWSLGDGSWFYTTLASQRNITYTYTIPDSYTAQLTVSNDDGSDTTIPGTTITVTSAGMPPVANFTSNVSSGIVPLSVQFTDTSTGSPTSWNWSFGDIGTGNTSTLRDPVHTYTAAGNYTISLNVTNADGFNQTIKTGYINVSSGEWDVTTCKVISSPGYYILQNDILDSAATKCIDIRSSAVTFDGNGHTIDGIDTTSTYGIYVYNFPQILSNILIKNVTVTDWYSGIDISYANKTEVVYSNANSNVNWGIHFSSSPTPTECNITGNRVFNNANFGIGISGISFSNISDNIAQGDNTGLSVDGGSRNNTIVNNTASGNGGGISLLSAGNNTCIKNSADGNNGHGITVASSSNNIFENVSARNNTNFGIIVHTTSNNNTFLNVTSINNQRGFEIQSSSYTTLTSSTVSNNTQCGLWLESQSYSNVFNNFFNNSENFFFSSEGSNTWNTTKIPGTNIIGGSFLGGNYWAQPNGQGFSQINPDTDGDGISNTEYNLSAGNIDRLPLTNNFSSPAPVANFTANITSGTAPLAVRFNDTSTGSPTSWNWSFGDTGAGNTSMLQNPVHSYTGSGNYTVSLNVTYAGGFNLTTKAEYIHVTGTGQVHNLNTSQSFTTLQAAINDPLTLNGHIIEVDPGTYYENVKVNKSLTIRSFSGNATDTIIRGMSNTAHVVEIAASSVTINGFTVRNGTGTDKAGVYMASGTRDALVLNTTLTGNYRGASLFNSTNAFIMGSTLSENSDNGIVVESSKNTTVIGTTVSGNQKTGIYIYRYNTNLTIADSYFNANSWDGIYSDISYSGQNNNITIRNNTISNHVGSAGSGFYRAGILIADNQDNWTVTDNRLNGNSFGLFYRGANSQGHTIERNTFTGNGDGIVFWDGDNGIFRNNTFLNNDYGIWFSTTYNDNNRFYDTTLNGSRNFAIVFENGQTVSSPLLDGVGDQIIQNTTINGQPYFHTYGMPGTVIRDVTITEQNMTNCGAITVYSNDTVLENVTVQGHRSYGIWATRSNNLTLSHVNITQSGTLNTDYYGLVLQSSTGVSVSDSSISMNKAHGIYFESTTNASVTDSTISGNQRLGMYIYRLNNNLTIADSDIAANVYDGIYSDNSYSYGNNNITVRNNTISSHVGSAGSGFYRAGILIAYNEANWTVTDNRLNGNSFGLFYRGRNSQGHTIERNNFTGNTNGIVFWDGDNGVFRNNRFLNNDNGIWFSTTYNDNNQFYDTVLDGSRNFAIVFENGQTVSSPLLDGVGDQIIQNTTVNGQPYYHTYGVPGTVIRDITITEQNMTNCGAITVYSNDTVLENVTVQGHRSYGIWATRSNNLTLSHVNITQSGTLNTDYYGLVLQSSTDVSVRDSSISMNKAHGIEVESTMNTLIEDSAISDNQRLGMYIYRYNTNLTIADSTFSSNIRDGIYSDISYSGQNHNITIRNNTISSHVGDAGSGFLRAGIVIASNQNNWSVTDNRFIGNGFGIFYRAANSQGHTVERNNFTGNTDGIVLYNGDNGIFRSNSFTNNTYGINIADTASDNNLIYNNNFLSRITSHALSPDTDNRFNTSFPEGGNYWSDYTARMGFACADDNSDGFCDVPYNIAGSGNQKDYWPYTIQLGGSSLSPVANFTANITRGAAPFVVQFNDTSINSPTSWFWDFGDGTNSTNWAPVHMYTTPGHYTVALKTSNAAGSDWENRTEFITVSTPPVVSNVILASESGFNLISDNLTVTWESSDTDGDEIKNITNWYRNGTSITALAIPFEGGSGTTFTRDYSGNGNNGTVNGATWNATGGHDGRGTYVFDGSNDYIDLGLDPSLQVQDEISLSAWIHAPVMPNDQLWAIVCSQDDTPPSGISMHLDSRLNPDGQTSPRRHIAFQIGDGSFHVTNANSVVPVDQWVHVVATRKANEPAKIYYNGVLQPSTSVSWTGSVSYINNWTIGRESDYSNRYFKGSIDDVQIFNRALSPGQVMALYENRHDLIVSQETWFGDVWRASITPNDGYGDGSTVISNTLEIQNNNLPVADNVLLSSDSGYNLTSDNLTLSWTVSDANSDPVRNITNWYLNGSSLMALNMPFEGGSNNSFTRDYSGNEHNGIVSGPIWNITGGYGGAGAYSFDAVDDYIDTGTFNSKDPHNCTLTAWVNVHEKPPSNNGYILAKGNDASASSYAIFVYGTSNTTLLADFMVRGSAAQWAGSPAGSLTTDSWHHIAGVIQGQTMKIYLDGEFMASNTISGTISPSEQSVWIGAQNRGGYNYRFKGLIDEVQMYNRSLSADEIKILYQGRSYIMSANEITPGDTWQGSITPNDGYEDGITVYSNSIIISSDVSPTGANFTANATSGNAPFAVQFTDTSSGSPDSWNWSFGDGDCTNANMQNPVHVYQTPGIYSVNLNVTNASGFYVMSKPHYIRVDFTHATMFRSDRQHTGIYSTGGIEPTNYLKWDFTTAGQMLSSPAVADGVVYVGSADHKLYAIDAHTGTQKWNVTLAYGVDSSPAVADDVVYFFGREGYLHAFYTNGTFKWDRDLGGDAYNGVHWRVAPTLSDGIVYQGATKVGISLNALFAINANNGTVKWTFNTDGDVQSAAAVYNGTVYVVSNKLYAIDASTGTERWNSSLYYGGPAGSPSVVDGVVYLGWSRAVVAFDAAYGSVKWIRGVGWDVYSSPAVENDIVYIGCDDSYLYAIHTTNGTVKWQTNLGAQVQSSPAVADGIVYVGDANDRLYAVHADNGTIKWNYLTGGDITSSPAVADGHVYFGSLDNKIYALGGNPPAPVANFTANVTSGPIPLTVQFNDTSTGSPTTWFWDFSDGNTSTLQNATNVFSIPGNYTIRLNASNSAGFYWENKTDYINVTSSGSVHNLNTTKSFTTIQAAINDPATLNGHVIEVDPGTYNENIVVNKSLTIRSSVQNPSTTIVLGVNPASHVVNVTANFVNISGILVRNATGASKAGIYVGSGFQNVTINNVIATENYYGTYLVGNTRVSILGSNMSSNSDSGVLLDSTNTVNITGCSFSLNKNGVYLWHEARFTSITDSVFDGNSEMGIRTGTSGLYDNHNVTVANNTFRNHAGSGDAGIILYSYNNNWSVIGNRFTGNDNGIYYRVVNAVGYIFEQNNFTGNTYGFNTFDGDNALVCNNVFRDNVYGIMIGQTGSDNNAFIGNSIDNSSTFAIGFTILVPGTLDNLGDQFFFNNTINGQRYYHSYGIPNFVVRDVVITNPKITNAGAINIYSNDTVIDNVTVTGHNSHGIFTVRSKNLTLSNSNISGNGLSGGSYYGVQVSDSTNVNILASTFLSNANSGILLDSTNTVNITGCSFSLNKNGVYLWHEARFTNITDSVFDGNSEMGIRTGTSGLYDNHNVTVANNTFRNHAGSGDAGIILNTYNNNWSVIGNRFTGNDNGIYYWVANGVGYTFEQNNFTGNTYGIYVNAGDNAIIRNNTFLVNTYSINIANTASDTNLIYNNNFLSRITSHASCPDTDNYFNATLTAGGNYWSDYATRMGFPCSDVNGDGFCDVPYNVSGTGLQKDYLPYAYEIGSVAPPVANFTANVTSGDAPLAVQFTDISASPGITSWSWDFDNDGFTDSTVQNPVHTYPIPGNYSVNFTVTNSGGSNSIIKPDYISVAIPYIDVSVDPVSTGFGSMLPGTYQNAYTDVNITSSSTSWNVEVAEATGTSGHMRTTGGSQLTSPLEWSSNNGADWHALSPAGTFITFKSGTAPESNITRARFSQVISTIDPEGSYSITVLFTGYAA